MSSSSLFLSPFMLTYVLVVVTVMHVLLFVFAAILSVCEGDGSAGVGFGGGVVAVSAYMGGTHGPGVLASAGDVLEISVVRGVGGVYDMCTGMCLARGGVGAVGGEWVTGYVYCARRIPAHLRCTH